MGCGEGKSSLGPPSNECSFEDVHVSDVTATPGQTISIQADNAELYPTLNLLPLDNNGGFVPPIQGTTKSDPADPNKVFDFKLPADI